MGSMIAAIDPHLKTFVLNVAGGGLMIELGANSPGIASSLSSLGDVAYAQGDDVSARTLYKESLAIRRDLEDKGGIAGSLECLSAVAATQGRTDQAVQMWGAASTLRDSIGSSLPPNERENYNRQVASARQVLGDEAFAVAWMQGRAMTPARAIQLALSEPSA